MFKIIGSFLLICITSFAYCHEDSLKYKNSFFVNVSSLVPFIQASSDPFYSVLYKRKIHNNNIRLGLGAHYERNIFDRLYQYESNYIRRSISPRLGFETTIINYKNWNLSYAQDIYYSSTRNTNNYWIPNLNSIKKDRYKNKSYGTAFILGTGYWINSRINIRAELRVKLYYYKNTNEIIYSNVTIYETSKTKTETTGIKVDYFSAGNFFVGFSF